MNLGSRNHITLPLEKLKGCVFVYLCVGIADEEPQDYSRDNS